MQCRKCEVNVSGGDKWWCGMLILAEIKRWTESQRVLIHVLNATCTLKTTASTIYTPTNQMPSVNTHSHKKLTDSPNTSAFFKTWQILNH